MARNFGFLKPVWLFRTYLLLGVVVSMLSVWSYMPLLLNSSSEMPLGSGLARASSPGNSIKFGGNKNSRVSVPISGPINVGAANFTIEWWMKPVGISAGQGCSNGVDVFTNGALIIDRDVFGPGDFGDFGLSLMSDGRVAFSIHNGSTGVTACSSPLTTGQWYYMAAVKNGNSIKIYVNGVLADSRSWSGNSNLSYDLTRSSSYSADPYFVFGAEKHTSIGGESFTAYHYNGFMDDLRISNIARTISSVPTAPFVVDGNTVALFRFDGNASNAVSGSPGGTALGVSYSSDVPFSVSASPSPSGTPTASSTPTPPSSPSASASPTNSPPPTYSASPSPSVNASSTPSPSNRSNPTNSPTVPRSTGHSSTVTPSTTSSSGASEQPTMSTTTTTTTTSGTPAENLSSEQSPAASTIEEATSSPSGGDAHVVSGEKNADQSSAGWEWVPCITSVFLFLLICGAVLYVLYRRKILFAKKSN